MIRLWLTFFICCVFEPLSYGFASKPIILESVLSENLIIGKQVEYAFDPKGEFDPTQSGAPLEWKRSDQDTPSFGYREGSVWLRTQVVDRRSSKSQLILKISYPPLDYLDVLFFVDGHWQRLQAGDHVPRTQWAMRYRVAAFPLPALGSSDTIDIYIRTKGSSSLIVPLVLSERDEFEQQILLEEAIQSLYFGALLILGLYNFLIYLSSRLLFYGSYVLFIVGFAFIQGSMGGQVHYYINDKIPEFSDFTLLLGVGIGSIGLTLFVMTVFELGKNPKLRRIWLYSGRFVTGSALALFLLPFMIPYSYALKGTYLVAFFAVSYSLVSILLALRERERMARWFLLAWTAFIFGTLAVILRGLGLVPANVWTNYSQQIGSAIEFTLLSFAMADRIKIMQEKINFEREHVLKAEQAAREADLRSLAASEAALLEQKRLSELKDNFLANTSHELRTPLNGMIGMSESILAHNTLGDSERASIQEILGASRRLAKIVGEIMDFSASKQGQIKILWENLSLHHLLNEALTTQAESFAGKQVSIANDLPVETMAIHGDRARVVQVLNAIISNAYKFMEKGRITIKGRVEENFVELVIRDSGSGIPQQQLKSIHEGFEQGDGSAARKQGGTGLGLALAHKLMAAQRGGLEIQSVVGLGTTVIMRFEKATEPLTLESRSMPLPAVSSEKTIITTAAPHAEKPTLTTSSGEGPARLKRSVLKLATPISPPSSRKKVLILVVDDDELNRRVLREHLNNDVYEVKEASSGIDALKLLDQYEFEAVLLDVMMPGMTGYQVCAKLRETYSQTELPVLMLTAKQQVEDLLTGFHSGANDYVLKPFVRDELLARLDTHLNISQTARAMQRFVPQDYIRLLGHEKLTEVNLGEVVEQNMVILFTDIVGFTSILESMQPREAFAWLNNCYRILGPEIRRFGGIVDKYIGDAVMALFPGSPDDALQAALNMHLGTSDLKDIRLGTGLHWGQTMLGTLGEPERFETTVLSDSVNIASRVEGAAKIFGCQIAITGAMRSALKNPNLYEWRRLGRVRFKGREGAIELFELLSADPNRAIKSQSKDEFEKGVACFERGAFMEATMHFQTVIDRNPNDLAADFYVRRIKHIEEAHVTNFDGILTLTSKS